MKPNPKIQRAKNDLAKLDAKIAEMQTKRRELERQITELENTEIVAAVRSMSVTPEQLPALLAALRDGGPAILAASGQQPTLGQQPASGQVGPKSEPATETTTEDIDDEE